MNKYKRCKRCRDKKTMPAPDFPKIGKFVYFSPTRHGKTEKVINISNYYKISDENYNYVLYIGDELLKIWLNELQRMIPYIHKIFLIFKLLIPLMQTKQDMERGGESRN